MPAFFTTQIDNGWGSYVPYTFENEVDRNEWIKDKIDNFNSKFSTPIWKPRDGETDYVEIASKKGSSGGHGKKGRMQELKVSTATDSRSGGNLYHEMGHAMGLGHTYFHTGCRSFTDLFGGTDKTTFDSLKGGYTNHGIAFVDSMMVYSPSAFLSSPRIQRVVAGCSGNRTQLSTLKTHLETLKQQRSAVQSLNPRQLTMRDLTNSNLIPSVFRNTAITWKYTDGTRKEKITKSDQVKKLDLTDLTEFISDVGKVSQYWIFSNPAQNMNITTHDKALIKKLFNLT